VLTAVVLPEVAGEAGRVVADTTDAVSPPHAASRVVRSNNRGKAKRIEQAGRIEQVGQVGQVRQAVIRAESFPLWRTPRP